MLLLLDESPCNLGNLPAEESGIKAFKRIGNETSESSDEAFTVDVMTEAGGKGGVTRRTQAVPA